MEDEEDPLDAFMASLDSEIVNQATLTSNINTSSDHVSPHSVELPPTLCASGSKVLQVDLRANASATQLSIARKVMESPYCDVLGKESRSRQLFYAGTGKELGIDSRKAEESCLKLILTQPAEFLRRYGHILAPDDLDSFVPSDDPDVGTHVMRLKALKQQQRQLAGENGHDASDIDMEDGEQSSVIAQDRSTRGVDSSAGTSHSRRRRPDCPPDGPRARNRRYRKLQQLGKGGKWFSDEAMKDRDPWLWYEHVGKVEGEERPAPRGSEEEVPGYTTVQTYLRESLGFLSQQPREGEWLGNLSGARGKAQSVGMAFLSSACAPRAHAPSLAAIDRTMSIHANVKPDPQCTVLARSGDTGVLNIGTGQDVDLGDAQTPGPGAGVTALLLDGRTGTEAARAALEACSIGGDQGVAPNEERSRRVRFAEQRVDGGTTRGDDAGRGRDSMDEDGDEDEDEDEGDVDDVDDEGVPEDIENEDEGEPEWAQPGGREEVARILAERFLAGEEVGIDYALIDVDETLDDLDQLGRDEQDRWFRSQGEDGAD